MTNSVAQIKTVDAEGPEGPTTAMMIAVNIGDTATAPAFASTVADKFKLHRTLAPPNTSMLLITLIGGMSASEFAACWKEIEAEDPVVEAYMSMMVVADVVQGTKAGQQISTASLLDIELA